MQWYLVVIFMSVLSAVLLIFHALGFFKKEEVEKFPTAKIVPKANEEPKTKPVIYSKIDVWFISIVAVIAMFISINIGWDNNEGILHHLKRITSIFLMIMIIGFLILAVGRCIGQGLHTGQYEG